MSADIGPGDYVEVVRGAGVKVPLGSVHCVSEVRTSPEWRCTGIDGSIWHDGKRGVCFGVRFADGPNREDGKFWNGCCVRPIYRPKSSFIEGLKQPAPKEPVPA